MQGSWAKWNRAVEHFNDLKVTSAEWLRGAWEIETPFDPERGAYIATFCTRSDYMDRLRIGTIAGDCFHNLRSALDFVMWQLILKHWEESGTTPPSDPGVLARLPTFPLARDDQTMEDFEKGVRQIPVLSESAKSRIVEVHDFAENGAQPYLRSLRVLSNFDKHRVLLIARARVYLQAARFRVDPTASNVRVERLLRPTDPFDDGTEFAAIRFDPMRPDAEVKLARRPDEALQLEYIDGGGFIDIWTMTGVVLTVQEVLDRLQPLFAPTD